VALKERLLLRVARRWIAGDSRTDALKAAAEANRLGLGAIINYLGEGYHDLKDIDDSLNEYMALLEDIERGGLRACISVKPTQLGLALGPQHYMERIERIAELASRKNLFVWIDMEGSNYTQSTLSTYAEIHERFKNTGVAIQANLHRTYQDVLDLLPIRPRFRLTKGAYREPEHIAYRSRKAVTENFKRIMKLLFENNAEFAIATHDEKLIDLALQWHSQYSAKIEFQMLRGIRGELKVKLAAQGYQVWEYIPYGSRWWHYSMRRIREHPSNLLLLLRSLFSE
jgi:proline dehydrogenase